MNRKILVIDDEEDVLEFLKLFLEANNNEVIVADNCYSAIDLFCKHDFFMVITDIAMPEMDGYEIISKLHEIKPDTQFAVMTGFGYNPEHTLIKINEDYPSPCIFKPFNRKKVLEIISDAFEHYNKAFS